MNGQAVGASSQVSMAMRICCGYISLAWHGITKASCNERTVASSGAIVKKAPFWMSNLTLYSLEANDDLDRLWNRASRTWLTAS